MNLALGSLYAWSVFVPPLEREFGWSRAADILGLYDCHRLLRADVRRGRPSSGREGPEVCALAGGILVSARFHPGELHHLAGDALSVLRCDCRRRQRIRLCDADTRRIQMVSRSPRPGRRPDGRRLRRRVRNLWHTGQRLAGAVVRLARDVPDSRRHLLRHDDGRNRAAEKPAARLPSTELDAFGRRCRARGILDGSDARNAGVLLAVDCVLPRDHRRTDDHQPAGAVRAIGRPRRDGRNALADCQLVRQCRRPDSVGLDVRHDRTGPRR